MTAPDPVTDVWELLWTAACDYRDANPQRSEARLVDALMPIVAAYGDQRAGNEGVGVSESECRHDIEADATGVGYLCRKCGWEPESEAYECGLADGRESVGLGDFVVSTCDEEAPAPAWYFVEQYGDHLPCSRSAGHDGEHEHSDSGYTWADR